MSLAQITFHQIIIIFLIIVIGYICYKVKLIDDATNEKLSNILLMLVNPMVILVSYQRAYDSTLVKGLLISLVLSAVTHLASIGIAYLVSRYKDKESELENKSIPVERFSLIYSNVGFIGIPLINGIFGSEGVFYVTAALTMFNVFLWTHGVISMSNVKKINFKTMLKKILSPSIIAVILGMIIFFGRITLPSAIREACQHVANLNTPFAMIIAGVTIGKMNLFKTIKKWRLYYISAFKLIIIPVLLAFLFSLFPMEKIVYMTAVIMAAVPSGATGVLFSIKYQKNTELAAEIFALTTLASLATIPLVVSVAEWFVK